MNARYIVADVFEGLASLEDDSVDLVFSSPPFLALRSYLPADHPDKAKEIGSEATPADFLDTLLDVVEACDRVLAPHGSLCFELGDTYSGSGGAGGDYNEGGLRADAPKFSGSALSYRKSAQRNRDVGVGWPLDKSLCLIPTLFAASLAYGYNMLRPERKTPRWRVRNLVVWARPNPPVGALGDKFRPATSYVTVATKSARRYFDLDAVRTAHKYPETATRDGAKHKLKDHSAANPSSGWETDNEWIVANPAGAPPLDYWVIPTHPYPGSHYATFPPDLVVKPVASMCPQRVCRVCGEPSRRVTTPTEYESDREDTGRPLQSLGSGHRSDRPNAEPITLGWTDCGCQLNRLATQPMARSAADSSSDKWRAGTVLDPFAGSGTTLAVATGHGRDAIGIDLDERNAELALERVGPMFLTVEHLNAEPAA